jgi:hypothetical protein
MEKLMTYIDNNKESITDGEYLELCNNIKELYDFKNQQTKRIYIQQSPDNIMNNLIEFYDIRKLFIENDDEILTILNRDTSGIDLYISLLRCFKYKYLDNRYCFNSCYHCITYNSRTISMITIKPTDILTQYLIKDKDYMTYIINISNEKKRLLKKWIM